MVRMNVVMRVWSVDGSAGWICGGFVSAVSAWPLPTTPFVFALLTVIFFVGPNAFAARLFIHTMILRFIFVKLFFVFFRSLKSQFRWCVSKSNVGYFQQLLPQFFLNTFSQIYFDFFFRHNHNVFPLTVFLLFDRKNKTKRKISLVMITMPRIPNDSPPCVCKSATKICS